MLKYLCLRIGSRLFTLLIVTVILIALPQLPGSPVDAMLTEDATEDQIQAFIREWGLEQPL